VVSAGLSPPAAPSVVAVHSSGCAAQSPTAPGCSCPPPWTQKTTIPTSTATATQHGTGDEPAGYQVEQIREWLRRAGWRYFWRTPLVRSYSMVVADAA